jgi:hypothetical protein
MKKIALISLLLIEVLLLQSCSGFSALGSVDRNCPDPSKNQLNGNGYLILQNGVTLKCQVKNYTNRMPCIGITDSTGIDGWVCNNREKTILFIFDENEILKDMKTK